MNIILKILLEICGHGRQLDMVKACFLFLKSFMHIWMKIVCGWSIQSYGNIGKYFNFAFAWLSSNELFKFFTLPTLHWELRKKQGQPYLVMKFLDRGIGWQVWSVAFSIEPLLYRSSTFHEENYLWGILPSHA